MHLDRILLHMGISTKHRKTWSSIVKRIFAKQHYQLIKVQKLAGRLRLKKHYHPLWFLLTVFCLLVHLVAPKNRTKSNVLYGVSSYWKYHKSIKIEGFLWHTSLQKCRKSKVKKNSLWQQSEPCYCEGGTVSWQLR